MASWLRWPWIGRNKGVVVPAIRLQGVIGNVGLRGQGLTLASLERALDAAFAVKKAPAVVLIVNSPGGSPVQSSLIAQRIRHLAVEKEKLVLAFVEDVAASGGYWLACAADEIIADESSVVGSIGVISAGFGFTEAIAKLGVERRVHTAGTSKSLLDPFQPERPEDVAFLQSLQEEIHDAFKRQVRDRRAGRLADTGEDLFDGRFWTGRGGLALGLVDGIGEARQVVRQRYGKEATLRVMNQPRSRLQRLFRMEHMADGFAAGVVGALADRAMWQRYGL